MLDQPGDRLAQPAGSTLVGRQILLARERHHPAHQFGAMFGGVAHLVDDHLLALAERQAPFEHVDPAEHRGEQVVEVVRDAAGQLADRLHLAGLDELLLEPPLRGDVEQRAGPALAAVAPRRRRTHCSKKWRTRRRALVQR